MSSTLSCADFLFEKLSATPESPTMVSDAVAACVRRERWDRAFELILSFGRDDLVETALGAAYMPLIRSGHTGTLAAFATKVRVAPAFPPAVVDLAEADIALADGAFELASRIAAAGGQPRLGDGHDSSREPRRSLRRALTHERDSRGGDGVQARA